MMSPWPSVYDMAGGGTPRIPDLVGGLLEAGYGIDFIAPKVLPGEQRWFPGHELLRVYLPVPHDSRDAPLPSGSR